MQVIPLLVKLATTLKVEVSGVTPAFVVVKEGTLPCLLYTSDAADERSSVDLGGRRIIKKKNKDNNCETM